MVTRRHSDGGLRDRPSGNACGHRAPAPGTDLDRLPNNPTGNLFTRESILAIVAASPGLVVVDEAYYAFSGGATFLDEVGRHPNLVLVRTVSKLGLAGLRLGFAVGPRDWLAEFDKVRLPYNVNVLSAAAAEFILARHEILDGQTRESSVTGNCSRPGWMPSPASGALRPPRTSSWCGCRTRRGRSRG